MDAAGHRRAERDDGTALSTVTPSAAVTQCIAVDVNITVVVDVKVTYFLDTNPANVSINLNVDKMVASNPDLQLVSVIDKSKSDISLDDGSRNITSKLTCYFTIDGSDINIAIIVSLKLLNDMEPIKPNITVDFDIDEDANYCDSATLNIDNDIDLDIENGSPCPTPTDTPNYPPSDSTTKKGAPLTTPPPGPPIEPTTGPLTTPSLGTTKEPMTSTTQSKTAPKISTTKGPITTTSKQTGCLFNNIFYVNGDKLPNVCTKLTCENGEWVHGGRTSIKCKKGRLRNDPHFKTWYRTYYSWHGRCNYSLAQDGVGMTPSFGVTSKFEQCLAPWDGASCLREISFKNDDNSVVTFKNSLSKRYDIEEIKFNGAVIRLTSTPKLFGPKNALAAWRGKCHKKSSDNRCVCVLGSQGIMILNCGWSLHIWAEKGLQGRLYGLLGYFNDKKANQFTARDGTVTNSKTTAFCKSWEASSCSSSQRKSPRKATSCTTGSSILNEYIEKCTEHVKDLDLKDERASTIENCAFDRCVIIESGSTDPSPADWLKQTRQEAIDSIAIRDSVANDTGSTSTAVTQTSESSTKAPTPAPTTTQSQLQSSEPSTKGIGASSPNPTSNPSTSGPSEGPLTTAPTSGPSGGPVTPAQTSGPSGGPVPPGSTSEPSGGPVMPVSTKGTSGRPVTPVSTKGTSSEPVTPSSTKVATPLATTTLPNICKGTEEPKCIKKKGECITKDAICIGKRKPLCTDGNCECCVPKKPKKPVEPSKKCLKNRGVCLKIKKKKPTKCDGTLDTKACKPKKYACCWPNCCKDSDKCAKAGGFCTLDAKSCTDSPDAGTTNGKLQCGKGCTCCIHQVCVNDPAAGFKACTIQGGKCTSDKKACKRNGGKFKLIGCKYGPKQTSGKRRCGCCIPKIPKIPKCCVRKKNCFKKKGKCISSLIPCKGTVINKGCKGENCQCCTKKKTRADIRPVEGGTNENKETGRKDNESKIKNHEEKKKTDKGNNDKNRKSKETKEKGKQTKKNKQKDNREKQKKMKKKNKKTMKSKKTRKPKKNKKAKKNKKTSKPKKNKTEKKKRKGKKKNGGKSKKEVQDTSLGRKNKRILKKKGKKSGKSKSKNSPKELKRKKSKDISGEKIHQNEKSNTKHISKQTKDQSTKNSENAGIKIKKDGNKKIKAKKNNKKIGNGRNKGIKKGPKKRKLNRNNNKGDIEINKDVKKISKKNTNSPNNKKKKIKQKRGNNIIEN